MTTSVGQTLGELEYCKGRIARRPEVRRTWFQPLVTGYDHMGDEEPRVRNLEIKHHFYPVVTTLGYME
jgi:hypothetical protein